MGELCRTCPKPLLDVGGEPLLGHILKKLGRAGLQPDTVYVQPGDVMVTRYVEANVSRSNIEFLPCDRELGPFYWIRNVYQRVPRRILAVYGDFYAPSLDIQRFVEHAERIDTSVVAAIGDSLPTTQAAVFDIEGPLVRDWTRKQQNQAGDLLNVGCYLIQHDAQVDATFAGCESFLEDDFFPRLIPERRFGVYVVPGRFINVNTPDNLASARLLAR